MTKPRFTSLGHCHGGIPRPQRHMGLVVANRDVRGAWIVGVGLAGREHGVVIFAGFFSVLVDFFALALAMDCHHRQLWQRYPAPATRWLLRAVGWTGLLLSLFTSAAHSGWSVGPVLWFGLLTVAALLVTMFFTYGPVPKKL